MSLRRGGYLFLEFRTTKDRSRRHFFRHRSGSSSSPTRWCARSRTPAVGSFTARLVSASRPTRTRTRTSAASWRRGASTPTRRAADSRTAAHAGASRRRPRRRRRLSVFEFRWSLRRDSRLSCADRCTSSDAMASAYAARSRSAIDVVGCLIGALRLDRNQLGEVAVDRIAALPDRLRFVPRRARADRATRCGGHCGRGELWAARIRSAKCDLTRRAYSGCSMRRSSASLTCLSTAIWATPSVLLAARCDAAGSMPLVSRPSASANRRHSRPGSAAD